MRAETRRGERGVTVLHVLHASRVAAIPTAAGPARLLDAGLAEAVAETGARVEVLEVGAPPDSRGEIGTAFAVADRVARAVRRRSERGRLVIVLSGSCHAGIGSLSGLPGSARGVIWLDCHGDFNTPDTTESGLLDGTTLAAIAGRCWKRLSAGVAGFAPVPEEDILLVGARDLDPAEAELLSGSGVHLISREEAPPRLEEALRGLGRRVDGAYLHIDLDVLDPSVGRANRYATEGGLSREELRRALEQVTEHCPVRVVGLASYEPSADEGGTVCEAALEIARLIADRAVA